MLRAIKRWWARKFGRVVITVGPRDENGIATITIVTRGLRILQFATMHEMVHTLNAERWLGCYPLTVLFTGAAWERKCWLFRKRFELTYTFKEREMVGDLEHGPWAMHWLDTQGAEDKKVGVGVLYRSADFDAMFDDTASVKKAMRIATAEDVSEKPIMEVEY